MHIASDACRCNTHLHGNHYHGNHYHRNGCHDTCCHGTKSGPFLMQEVNELMIWYCLVERVVGVSVWYCASSCRIRTGLGSLLELPLRVSPGSMQCLHLVSAWILALEQTEIRIRIFQQNEAQRCYKGIHWIEKGVYYLRVDGDRARNNRFILAFSMTFYSVFEHRLFTRNQEIIL